MDEVASQGGGGAAHSSKLRRRDRSTVSGVCDVAGVGLIQRGGTPTGFCVIVLGTGGPDGTGLDWLAGFLGSGWRSKLPLVQEFKLCTICECDLSAVSKSQLLVLELSFIGLRIA